MEEKRVTLSTEQNLSTGCMEIRNSNDVTEIFCLHRQGWGTKKIAEALEISRNTVRKYLRQGEWKPCQSTPRIGKLAKLSEWLRERFRRHGGNADVVRQELEKEHGIQISLRTVERAVEPWRREMTVEREATVRHETAPGRQMQIDFGEKEMQIGGALVRVHIFTATLGYSRRQYVQAFRGETQSSWFEGIESALRYFGGVPQEVLVDNAKALVTHNDRASGELLLNEKFKALAAYWGFQIRTCAPYRARTKGKVERYVGYGKNNGLAGRIFENWEALSSHITTWLREVSDPHVVSTTGESPWQRFERDEKAELRPFSNKAPFHQIRECVRKVSRDATVELDTNQYSVPWKHIGEEVRVDVEGGEIVIRSLRDGKELGRHVENKGRRQRIVQSEHLEGIVRVPRLAATKEADNVSDIETPVKEGELTRPLSCYEEAVNVA
jgi:transposase